MSAQTSLLPEATEPILTFDGPYRFLSMFAPCVIVPKGPWWEPGLAKAPTGEHWFHIAKVEPATEHATEHMDRIAAAPTAAEAKRLGQRRAFDEHEVTLRRDWEQVKVLVMLAIQREKFAYTLNWEGPGDEPLWRKLVATSPRVLVEGNHWGDTYWGVDRDGKGRGKNMLGRLLMLVRAELLVAHAAGLRPEELR